MLVATLAEWHLYNTNFVANIEEMQVEKLVPLAAKALVLYMGYKYRIYMNLCPLLLVLFLRRVKFHLLFTFLL